MPSLSIAERKAIVARIVAGKVTSANEARRLNVPKGSVSRWVKQHGAAPDVLAEVDALRGAPAPAPSIPAETPATPAGESLTPL